MIADQYPDSDMMLITFLFDTFLYLSNRMASACAVLMLKNVIRDFVSMMQRMKGKTNISTPVGGIWNISI